MQLKHGCAEMYLKRIFSDCVRKWRGKAPEKYAGVLQFRISVRRWLGQKRRQKSADNFLPLTAPTHPLVNGERGAKFAHAVSTKEAKAIHMVARGAHAIV